MRILWLLAHAAWREFCCYCPYVLRLRDEGKPIHFAMMRNDDPGLDNAIQSFESVLYLARSAISADDETPISGPRMYPNLAKIEKRSQMINRRSDHNGGGIRFFCTKCSMSSLSTTRTRLSLRPIKKRLAIFSRRTFFEALSTAMRTASRLIPTRF